MDLLDVRGSLLGLVKLFILEQHDGNGQVQHEKRADQDAEQEVEVDKAHIVAVIKDVSDVDPALERDALENGQEGTSKVVEI